LTESGGTAGVGRRPLPVARLNILLSLAFLLYGFALLWCLPLAVSDTVLRLLAWLPFIALTPTFWSLIHEAIHSTLLPDRRWNDRLGRALGVLFASPLDVVRFGHLSHHQAYNRTRDPGPARSAWLRWLLSPLYYLRIFGLVYFAEVAAPIVAWLPRSVIIALAHRLTGVHEAASNKVMARLERKLLAGDMLRRVRVDSLLILLAYGAGIYLYGGSAWIILAGLLLRGAMVSFMDNIYHHRPPGTSHRTLNLALPPWAAAMLLNANLHSVHHRRPGLSWAQLPAAVDREADGEPKNFLAAARDQLLIPL
jgi:fatty acid desaturase